MQKTLSAAPREIASSIQEFFKSGLAGSVASMLGESVEVVSAEDDRQQPSLWFRSDLSSPPEGYIEFGASKELWLGIGSRILGFGEDDFDAELVISTLKEISSQVAGTVISSLNHKYQRQLEIKEPQVGEVPRSSQLGSPKAFFNLSAENSETSIPITLIYSASLVETLTGPKVADETAVAPQALDRKLELLMDVEMPVTVSIGRAQLPLKDVIKLTTGSVVELSRSISEPVDIVVNNTLVARGDVVVVEGNFGVRIREVLSKEDRMKRFGTK
jgi:flagellar motor switch protein FliN/FliY